ncbi:P-loop containing nucleoside triphosphate hydrolase protein [Clavulina sp. PMI_390]|nr:P-loop containing nucleoside triphosphate hydrolase protein [Clavulina sp. PMI_390]
MANGTDATYEALPPAREDSLNLYQWLTFNWIGDFVYLGTQRPLQESDVWQLSGIVRAKVVMTKFRNFRLGSKLMRRVVAANAIELLLDFVLTLVTATLTVVQPFLMNLILQELTLEASSSPAIAAPSFIPVMLGNTYLSKALPARGPYLAYVYTGLAFLARLVSAQAESQRRYFVRRATTRIESELIGTIYEKALVRKDITGSIPVAKEGNGEGDAKTQPQGADVGKVVSLITVDASECANAVGSMSRLYELPIFGIGSALLLIQLMGWTAFVGFGMFLFTSPILRWITRTSSAARKELLAARDERLREMNQVIQGIRFLKFFAWEAKWVERVMKARERELVRLSKVLWLWVLIMLMWDVLPLFISIISFSAFIVIDHGKLSVAVAFPVLAAFDTLNKTLNMFPIFMEFWVKITTSVQRIEAYLNEDEVPSRASWLSDRTTGEERGDSTAIGFDRASFAWGAALGSESGASAPTSQSSRLHEGFQLKDISISFQPGSINLIAGPTGSGKSSLLAALLGEMDCVSGEVFLPKNHLRVDAASGLRGDVSFCAQHPWLQHMTIRDNILFGLPYDRDRMSAVLRACQLLPDLELFDDKDLTEIGEGGVSLSGGQKARVALARAVYSRSATVLLDDVLSAVDSHTTSKLIKECFLGPLMKGRTIIIATHHVDRILPHCSWVVRLENGSVLTQGPPEKIDSAILDPDRAKEDDINSLTSEPLAATEKVDEPPQRVLVEKEKKSEGQVLLRMYQLYIGAASYTLTGALILSILLQYAGEACQKFWVRYWGESYQTTASLSHGLPPVEDDAIPYLAIYIAIQAGTAFFTAIRHIPKVYATLRASRRIYGDMLLSVIRTPIRWFDQTPSGRILNRFSKDINLVDGELQGQIEGTVAMGIACITTIVVVVSVTPLFFFPLAIIIALQFWTSQGYVEVSRDLRRLESTFRSPIIAAFSELLLGITTVRAFGAEGSFVATLYKRLDRVQAAAYYYSTVNRWMMFRLNVLGAFVVGSATVTAIATGVSPGVVGIAIASSSVFVMDVYYMMQSYTDLQQAMNSMERIAEYLDLPSERGTFEFSRDSRGIHLDGPEGLDEVPAAWPRPEGGIVVQGLTIRYATDLEPVLRGVSFDVKPREKIGIVGRTGSGKSTLAMSFFRFVDTAPANSIIIDGVDINTLSLQNLRSRLTIIPQDAVLFAGNLRDNLACFPLETYDECIRALESAHLPIVAAAPDDNEAQSGAITPSSASQTIFSLQSPISENGNNLSGGQRQLVALARAILRRSGVVIMDESTSAVDFETDQQIQRVIRDEFKDSIMLTIAHRLETIMDYDRVMVLEDGRIIEFDSPAALTANKTSKFYGMLRAIDHSS